MTHYDTLGVPRDASAAHIKAAFRKLASQHHPDRGGDKDKSAAVNDAYACLSDTERRARYDASGEDRQAGPTPEEARRTEVQSALAKAVEDSLKHAEVEFRGLIAVARGHLDGAMSQGQQQKVMISSAHGMLERVLKKLRRKATSPGDDLVSMIVTGKLAELQRALDAATHALSILTEARQLLDAYEGDAPEASPQIKNNARMLEQLILQQFGNQSKYGI